MYCNKCGNQTKSTGTFCENCGSKLEITKTYENNNQNIDTIKSNFEDSQKEDNIIINNPEEKPKKKKKKKMVWLFILIIVIIAVVAILVLSPKKEEKSKKERTIMLYMVGSDLESEIGLATVDLDSIDYDKVDNENINIVLIAGGSKEWHNDYIAEDETSIYELTEDGFKKVKKQRTKNMGSASTLSDFLNYAYENYPANNFDLIFWNHGGAIHGSESDKIYGDNLSLEDMEKAFEDSPFKENNKLETIFFRTCLNGSIENALVFDDYAKYLVASEELTRGSQFSSVLNFINEIEVDDEKYDTGVKFIESYEQQIKDMSEIYKSSYYSTYSIVNLENVEELANSVNDFFEDINVSKNYNRISRVRSNLYQYSAEAPYYDMVDLYNLVNELKSLSPDKAEVVLENFEKTILYNWATSSQSKGLSIYFPYNGAKEYKTLSLDLYDDFDNLDGYNNFINDFYTLQSSPQKSYTFANSGIITQNEENADFKLELTDEQVEGFAKAHYAVFRTNKDGEYQPIYKGINAKLVNNTLTANIKNRQLKIVDKENPEDEYVLTTTEKNETDEYITYQASVILQNIDSDTLDVTLENASITIMVDKKTGEAKIVDALIISDDIKEASGVTVDINDYTHLIFGTYKYHILDDYGNYVSNWESQGTYYGMEVKTENIKIENYDFDDEYEYYCAFIIYDVNNNPHYTKLTKLQ